MKSLKSRVKSFRDARREKEDLEDTLKREQKELITALQEAGVTNEVGLVYDPDDESKGSAYVQQNSPSEYWDDEAIVAYLRKRVAGRKALWLACSTRVLDIQKFESEVAAGNISAKTAEKLKKTGKPSAPFIRFGKNKKGNL